MLVLALLLAAGVFAVGTFYYRGYVRHYRTSIEESLLAIAELKVGDLVRWRQERLGDGGVLFQNSYITALVRRILEKPTDADAQGQLELWFGKYCGQYQYEQVRLLDAQGVTRVSVPTEAGPVVPILARGAAEAMRSGQVTLQDFYLDADGLPRLAVLVPILDAADANRPLGVLVLRRNPATYLYPILTRWPTPSSSAETLLVRREGNRVVFLNHLRFTANTALQLSLPLDRVELPAAQAVQGREGIMAGVDYRSVAVVSALRSIPNSPWALVARMDAAEIYAPLRERLWIVVVGTSLLLVSAAAVVTMTWRQQSLQLYRSQAETAAALRASEVRYRRLFEAARDGILILDAETGMVVDVNPFLVELLGFSHAAFLGKKVWELGFLRDIVANADNFAELQQKGYVRYENMALEAHDGRRHEVEFISNVYQVEGRKVIQCNIRDISERVQAQAEILHLNTELEQRVVERTAQLQAANQELEAFSYSVSHDLRAPLRHVQGYVDLLMREASGWLSESCRRYMKTIADISVEMGVLIDDLLAFSRMGRTEMIEARVNLDALVQDALRDLEPSTRARRITWRISSLPTVQGDPAMLKLVLANLLGNAIKFTRPRDPAVIEVGVMNEEGRMKNEKCSEGTESAASPPPSSFCIPHSTFFVPDNGVGFDPQYAHKLFGVFQRLHRADEFEGTGIGLANVRRIIARHGGRTWAEGKLGAGATFYFTLKANAE